MIWERRNIVVWQSNTTHHQAKITLKNTHFISKKKTHTFIHTNEQESKIKTTQKNHTETNYVNVII